MKFLADECFDERLAARMRSAGCDVERVPTRSGMDDLAVAALAEGDDRVLLTHDRLWQGGGSPPAATERDRPGARRCD